MEATYRETMKSEKQRVRIGKYGKYSSSPEFHTGVELMYVIKGKLECFYKGKKEIINAGQAFFIDSKVIHYSKTLTDDTTSLLIILNSSTLQKYFDNIFLESPILKGDYQIPEFYEMIKKEIIENKKLGESEIYLQTCILFAKIMQNEKTNSSKAKSESEAFRNMLDDLEVNFKTYSLEKGANSLHMNESYFSRYFHSVMKVPFSKYLNYIRCKNALKMIKDGNVLIKEIAYSCGYNTIRNFNRQFKIYTGYNPTKIPTTFVLNGNYLAKNNGSSPRQNFVIFEDYQAI